MRELVVCVTESHKWNNQVPNTAPEANREAAKHNAYISDKKSNSPGVKQNQSDNVQHKNRITI